MKKTGFAAVAVVGGCLVALLMAEVVLRISNVWIGRHSDTMFAVIEYDEVLGWKMKPNLHDKINLVDVEGIPVRSNSAGFWDNEFVQQKPSHRYRIAFLGDSFTWGMGVRQEERFTSLVAATNPKWESLNFGIPGYGTDQSLLLWQHIAHGYKPDLVVLTVYQNDYVDNMCAVLYGRPKPYFELGDAERLRLRNVPVPTNDFWSNGIFNQVARPYGSLFQVPVQKRSRLVHWLAKNSDVARLSYTLSRLNQVRMESLHDAEKSDSDRLPQADRGASNRSSLAPVHHMQARLLGALVKQLAEQVKSAGAGFAVVLAGDPVPQHELEKEIFSHAGIAYLDATTEVLANWVPGGSGRVYYPYSKHWTPTAHRAVASLLAKRIREQAVCGERRFVASRMGLGGKNQEPARGSGKRDEVLKARRPSLVQMRRAGGVSEVDKRRSKAPWGVFGCGLHDSHGR